MAEAWATGQKTQVEIWTERYRIIGTTIIPSGAGHSWRFSDILNKPDRPFLPLTEVTIFSLDGGNLLWQGHSMTISKSFVVLATDEVH
ncbi:hypothetical protein MELA_00734 [Candidatus Methylomirabilis lanthanidiphila]|uniref:Uncharacterized protein n=1 Tax=Candidatus Methylomirabilis lanthanidiphila TaxID=2211376 RepID=A0A564ZGS6_9BACT|nr:hypothetical protein [Candidatus Methylomirabilis lanthanidiphila]VUZ84363.1 hypothetical protein MELA_00734 [Candidatus Methylomirabilis lanthanidiphila]